MNQSATSESVLMGLKKRAKSAVGVMEKVLPETAFKAFFDFTFPKYKQAVALAYRAKGLSYQLTGDSQNSEMAARIFEVLPYTLVGIGGLEATYRLAKKMNEDRITGQFVELGVARGGAAALMAPIAFEEKSLGRKLWLFDSYEGLPEPTDKDFLDDGSAKTGDHVRPLPKGSCLGQLEEVQHLLFDKFALPKNKVVFVKGWFQDTLPVKKEKIGPIALLRLDGDWYESTKVCLEHLYDQVTSGGAVIIDDYASCYGCQRAVDEFLLARKIEVTLTPDGRGGCYFIKP